MEHERSPEGPEDSPASGPGGTTEQNIVPDEGDADSGAPESVTPDNPDVTDVSADPETQEAAKRNSAEFRASLECYRGPLDLLLYLIKKDEVDVLDIPIGRITEQYLQYLQILQSLDPNSCGEFLVFAARLMEIKSRQLLPIDLPEDEDEEMEDPRLELVLQLLEYKKYKERAILLETMADDHKRRHRRPETDLDDLSEEPVMPLELGSVSVWDLLNAFQKVQLALNLRQPHRVLFEDRPLEDYVNDIEQRLATVGEAGMRFDIFFAESRDRYDAIGYFLALLELAKVGRILFIQETLFGSISVRQNPQRHTRSEEETDSTAGAELTAETAETAETGEPAVPGEELEDAEEKPRAEGESEESSGSDNEPDFRPENRISGLLDQPPSPPYN